MSENDLGPKVLRGKTHRKTATSRAQTDIPHKHRLLRAIVVVQQIPNFQYRKLRRRVVFLKVSGSVSTGFGSVTFTRRAYTYSQEDSSALQQHNTSFPCLSLSFRLMVLFLAITSARPRMYIPSSPSFDHLKLPVEERNVTGRF
jgi:hypothetical protein